MLPILETRALARIPHETWVVAPSVEQFVGRVRSESKREAGEPGDWYSGAALAGRMRAEDVPPDSILARGGSREAVPFAPRPSEEDFFQYSERPGFVSGRISRIAWRSALESLANAALWS